MRSGGGERSKLGVAASRGASLYQAPEDRLAEIAAVIGEHAGHGRVDFAGQRIEGAVRLGRAQRENRLDEGAVRLAAGQRPRHGPLVARPRDIDEGSGIAREQQDDVVARAAVVKDARPEKRAVDVHPREAADHRIGPLIVDDEILRFRRIAARSGEHFQDRAGEVDAAGDDGSVARSRRFDLDFEDGAGLQDEIPRHDLSADGVAPRVDAAGKNRHIVADEAGAPERAAPLDRDRRQDRTVHQERAATHGRRAGIGAGAGQNDLPATVDRQGAGTQDRPGEFARAVGAQRGRREENGLELAAEARGQGEGTLQGHGEPDRAGCPFRIEPAIADKAVFRVENIGEPGQGVAAGVEEHAGRRLEDGDVRGRHRVGAVAHREGVKRGGVGVARQRHGDHGAVRQTIGIRDWRRTGDERAERRAVRRREDAVAHARVEQDGSRAARAVDVDDHRRGHPFGVTGRGIGRVRQQFDEAGAGRVVGGQAELDSLRGHHIARVPIRGQRLQRPVRREPHLGEVEKRVVVGAVRRRIRLRGVFAGEADAHQRDPGRMVAWLTIPRVGQAGHRGDLEHRNFGDRDQSIAAIDELLRGVPGPVLDPAAARIDLNAGAEVSRVGAGREVVRRGDDAHRAGVHDEGDGRTVRAVEGEVKGGGIRDAAGCIRNFDGAAAVIKIGRLDRGLIGRRGKDDESRPYCRQRSVSH